MSTIPVSPVLLAVALVLATCTAPSPPAPSIGAPALLAPEGATSTDGERPAEPEPQPAATVDATPAPTSSPTTATAPPAALASHPSLEPLFAERVRPILAGCTPCHFPGGKMYDELPFDDPATVAGLGEKLFSRIDDPAEQEVLRQFFDAWEKQAADTS